MYLIKDQFEFCAKITHIIHKTIKTGVANRGKKVRIWLQTRKESFDYQRFTPLFRDMKNETPVLKIF